MTTFDPAATGALAGVRILDLTRVVAGNALTVTLGDFGADVIKIERPGRGDDLRNWRVKGISTFWKAYGRNKRSLSLDLRQDAGKRVLRQLVGTAQILVENFRPGIMEDMGFGPKDLHALNPALVIVRVSGWGQTGPYRQRPGFGSLVEAMSGFAAMNGYADRPPVLPPLALADMVAGLSGAMATLVALREVEVNNGRGQVVDLALFEPLFSILGPLAANHQLTGEVPPRMGNSSSITAPRGVYQTGDGGFVALSASTQGMWERLARAIDLEPLISDPRFLANADRVANVVALDQKIGGWIGARSIAENLARFEALDVTVGPVLDIGDLVAHPLVTERGLILDIPDGESDTGHLAVHGAVPRLTATPGAIRRPAPAVGEHNGEILSDLGFDAMAIAKLAEDGVI